MCSTSTSIEELSDAVESDEVVSDEGGGLGANAVGSSSTVFARGGDEELVGLEVGADGRLFGEGRGR